MEGGITNFVNGVVVELSPFLVNGLAIPEIRGLSPSPAPKTSRSVFSIDGPGEDPLDEPLLAVVRELP